MTATGGTSELQRFARGYLLSATAVVPPVRGWLSEVVVGLHLLHAPDVTVTRASCGQSFALVIGHIVDTERGLSPETAVDVAAKALARSELEFLDVTDAWSGRYLVLYGSQSARHVMTDATGMRSAFYSLEGSFVLASHARLVATVAGARTSPVLKAFRAVVRSQRRHLVMSMPGRSTPWTGVVHLTPNTVLDVETRRVRRVFPRNPLPELGAATAASLIGPQLSGQVAALVATGRPIALSVTAGLDTRVSVAASRAHRSSIRYFTYRRDGIAGNELDVATAVSIARDSRLPHTVVDVRPEDEPLELTQAIREATILSHGRAIVGAYRRTFPGDTIHIRSNVGEVGRSSYRQTWSGVALPADVRRLTPSEVARLWAHGQPTSRPIVEAFAEWMNAIAFYDVLELDALDVLYWEHRLACWHSNVILESDFAFDTHVLFNARSILRSFLSVPPPERRHGATFRLVIADLWPELLRWPTERWKWRSAAVAVRHTLRGRLGR
jgi:hypothetical protein